MMIFSLIGMLLSLLATGSVSAESTLPTTQERLLILCMDIEEDWSHMLDDPLHTLSHEESTPIVAPKDSVKHFNRSTKCGTLDEWQCHPLNSVYNLYLPPNYPTTHFNLAGITPTKEKKLPLAQLSRVMNSRASWDLMLLGHGHVDYAICGIPLHQFKKFLRWCEHINASSLQYLTCFGAGMNIEKVYTSYWEPETYNFLIINGSCIDNITYPFESFGGYFDAIAELDQTASYAEIATACQDTLYRPNDDTSINFPHVRYPYAESFMFDAHTHKEVNLHKASKCVASRCVASRYATPEVTEPISEKILEDDLIFDALVVDSVVLDNPRYIRSALPGHTVHYCASMRTTSPTVTIEQIGQAFFRNIGEPHYGKVYCIDRIECANGDIYTEVVVLINYCLVPKKPQTVLWYTQNDLSYKLLPKQQAKQLSHKEHALYQQVWQNHSLPYTYAAENFAVA